MAKRKKAAAKPAVARRSSRRGKTALAEAAAPAAEGEPSASADAAPAEPSNSDSQADSASSTAEASTPVDSQASSAPAMKNCPIPVVALHKKFGKYRLFNSDDSFTRKYEVGSDSETNSSIEIRVIDPCASSESDSNAALDTQSDTNSGACNSPINSSISALQSQSNSRDISPVPTRSGTPTATANLELKGNTEPPQQMETDTFAPSDAVPPDLSAKQSIPPEYPVLDEAQDIPVSQDIPLEEQVEQVEFAGDDDEVITIVQILEDDNPELYYSIKIVSPKDQTEGQADANEEDKKQDVDFQKHFENLNLTTPVESALHCSLGYSESHNILPACNTPDIPFPRENLNDCLARPDPSITPSSTLSDDSNSSRVTEQNQNNSNDSAESSPTGVRRSSRIKTISNLKQKTKGYGLVKTPLKKALITQTKLKLEEIGSDSQEKPADILPINAPNSPSFPVPSDMPVKVKSRWRRSSELEMGANSPANSPLASPSLPHRLPPVAEAQNTPEEEDQITPLSKEAYDRIIDERMRQFQHLDENEYLCERMISKETKKMICDCFMTKEELDRGELACGEDCLNRLLMIEW